jgi:nucleotide-binding universal stress UspA family protein
MYRRILLAYDGSLEGAVALREGALLARQCKARVFILSVIPETAGVRTAESLHAGVVTEQTRSYKETLARGVARLKQLGLEPVAKLVVGEPAVAIGAFAREIEADLVVLGHRRQSLLQRWWSGASGAYVSDHIRCSLLISRNMISDEVFEQALASGAEPSSGRNAS